MSVFCKDRFEERYRGESIGHSNSNAVSAVQLWCSTRGSTILSKPVIRIIQSLIVDSITKSKRLIRISGSLPDHVKFLAYLAGSSFQTSDSPLHSLIQSLYHLSTRCSTSCSLFENSLRPLTQLHNPMLPQSGNAPLVNGGSLDWSTHRKQAFVLAGLHNPAPGVSPTFMVRLLSLSRRDQWWNLSGAAGPSLRAQ
jgi:hypothetical protein